MEKKLNGKKVAVIGLDGMAWHILDKLFKYNAMPYLKSITEKCLKGILKSTIPPLTVPAWTSIATGVNPGKHGAFDFLIFSDNYNPRLVNSYDVCYPRIHEMIALKGLKTICINQPITYPILKVKNTIVISDWVSPKLCYYPESISKYVQFYKPATHPEKFIKYPENAMRESIGRINTVNQLAKFFDWNLFWVIYSEPDHIFHSSYHKLLKGERFFIKIFQRIDETIEMISKKADIVIIVSDHGFAEYKYTININSILYKLGLLNITWEKTAKDFREFLPKHATTNVRGVRLPSRMHEFLLKRPFLKLMVKKLYRRLTGKELTAEKPNVDIHRSKAFLLSRTSHGIYVREHSLIDFIINELEKVEGIKRAYKREEIYCGPHLNKAPNILVEPNFDKGFTIAQTTKIAPDPISVGNICHHHPDGILIIFGQGVSANWLRQPVRTVDIVPTILRYMGLPLPVDTDGEPLPNIDYPAKTLKRYDYLKHWKLVREVQLRKRKLAI